MLKALYDYGLRRQLTLPPVSLRKPSRHISPFQRTTTVSASIWAMMSSCPARTWKSRAGQGQMQRSGGKTVHCDS